MKPEEQHTFTIAWVSSSRATQRSVQGPAKDLNLRPSARRAIFLIDGLQQCSGHTDIQKHTHILQIASAPNVPYSHTVCNEQ